MKPQFQHQVVTSFALWLDHVILTRGEAFQNVESKLYYQEDERLDSDFLSFASPYKQWVNDSSVDNANIPQSINIDGIEVLKNQSGIQYDYNNGRVLIPNSVATETSNVEASYAVKDFNIYITDQTEEELLIETKFDKNSRFDQEVTNGVKPYDQVVPAIFISYEEGFNQPFAFGGEDITNSEIRCVVFAENSYQLDGVFSILKDLNNKTISNVGFNEHPLNEFGDLKNGIYSYKDLSYKYYNEKNRTSILHVDSVNVSKINDKIAKKSHPGLFIGFVDFTLHCYRFPRQDLYEPQPRSSDGTYIPIAPFQLSIDNYSPQENIEIDTEIQIDYSFYHLNNAEHNAEGYNIYRQEDSQDYILVNTIDASITQENEAIKIESQDLVTGCGKQFTYKITAFNELGEIESINPKSINIRFEC